MVLAVGMIIVLGVMSISLFKEVITPDYLAQDNVLNLLLEQALGLVIGFEFLRMLVKPTASNVIEVLVPPPPGRSSSTTEAPWITWRASPVWRASLPLGNTCSAISGTSTAWSSARRKLGRLIPC